VLEPVWLAAWATVGAALATAATGVVIALQTMATRRSVELSRTLAVEAVKARLDSRAPRLSVTFNTPFWPPFAVASHDVTVARGAQFLAGQEFRVPKDHSQILLFDVWGQVHNYGTTALDIVIHKPLVLWPEELQSPTPANGFPASNEALAAEAWKAAQRGRYMSARESTLVLQPGQGSGIRFAPQISLVDVVSASATGSDLALGVLTISDGFDDGVEDEVTVTLEGAALQRLADDDGAVRLTGTALSGEPPVRVQTAATVRNYFVSKKRKERLPSP